MKKKLLQQLIMASKYVLLGVFMQTLWTGLLLASDTAAQEVKSVREVYVVQKVVNTSVGNIMQFIESETDYNFSYYKDEIDLDKQINISRRRQSVYDLLVEVSSQTGLSFRQINNMINVKIKDKGKKNEDVEVVKIALTVAGIVTSLSEGEPLPGVNIVVKGTSTGTMTDIDGKYSINVPNEDDILVFSSIGYTTEKVPVNGRTVIDVALAEDIKSLSEVVVVGYGTQKKVNLTGAVAQVEGEVLENRVVPNIGQALQGVIPNLNVTTTGDPGGPGTNASFNIRGGISIAPGSSASPLFVVDGIPVDNINDINPTDVESMSVLKDAAASAIYGARAPYGVVIVTTKHGKKGEKATVSYSSMFGQSSYTRLPKMANSLEFAEAMNIASINSGQPVSFSPEQLEKIRQNIANPGTFPVSYPDPNNPGKWTYASPLDVDNVDWFQAYFKPWTFNQKHDVSLSGGSQNTTYYMGLGFYDQGGLFKIR